MDSTLDIFNSSPCFRDLHPEEIEYLKVEKKQISYQKGETICKQGAFAPYVLYVVDGLVKVYIELSRNRQKAIRLLRSGDFIAFQAVFGETLYQYTASAITDSNICMINKDALKNMLLENKDFAFRVVARNYLSENHLLETIKETIQKQMPGKLASALLYLSSSQFGNDSVFNYLTRKDLADFAGITTESTVKILKEFEQDGLIISDGKDIIIKNTDKLKDVSMHG
ncbi:MAG: Crp/Fnr family transcriptional regulator [Marinilabiliaceae bacterium]|nr:Crp/Fnr family transcriptional regulator [Marinilabiliaceae bacterium]